VGLAGNQSGRTQRFARTLNVRRVGQSKQASMFHGVKHLNEAASSRQRRQKLGVSQSYDGSVGFK
jgi:hypothetical protein